MRAISRGSSEATPLVARNQEPDPGRGRSEALFHGRTLGHTNRILPVSSSCMAVCLRSLFFGDEPIQRTQQRVHIAQGGSDCLLFTFAFRPRQFQLRESRPAKVRNGCCLQRDALKYPSTLAVRKQVRRKDTGNARPGPESKKLVLDRAWFRILVLIERGASNQLQTLAFVEEHIATPDLELFELLVSHRHCQHIINVDSSIEDILGAQVGTQRPWGVDS
jgi:hypothetical protein